MGDPAPALFVALAAMLLALGVACHIGFDSGRAGMVYADASYRIVRPTVRSLPTGEAVSAYDYDRAEWEQVHALGDAVVVKRRGGGR